MAELMNHPHEMRKLQAEVRGAAGATTSHVTEEHLDRRDVVPQVRAGAVRRRRARGLLQVGQDFRSVPFGAGFAAATMELALANMLYHLDWALAHGGGRQGTRHSERNITRRVRG
ncbi:cytochrome P450 71D95-like [Setaria italica]|uniref:cytochrome P450 71D95-like n=1 Tax=Setaria italica TaxID=4555 RepID=UPI00064645FD|nr:cytochrome P450 71D95-like [Setaria italica]